MQIVSWSPRNGLTGNRKLVTMFARELGKRHPMKILYPVVPDMAFLARLRQSLSRAGAVVLHDVPDGKLVAGVPAKVIGNVGEADYAF